MEKKHLFIGLASALGVVSVTFISLFVWKSVSSGNTPEPPQPQVVEHFVTFESNGGTHVATQRVKDGGKATEPTNPTRPNYQFDGWFDNPEFLGYSYNFDNVVTNDVTLYAQWIGGTIITTYKIDFQGENCSTTLDPAKEYMPGDKVEFTINVSDEEKYNLPTQIYVSGCESYEYISATGKVNMTIGTSNVSVVAIAEEKTPEAKWVVSFNANGGKVTGSNPIIVDDGETIANKPALEDRPGYNKEEVTWYQDPSFTTPFDFGEKGVGTSVTSNMVLYAKWGDIKTYMVKFYDGSTDLGLDQNVKYGEKVQRPVNPIKDGYTFKDWYSDAGFGSEYPFDTPLTGDSTTVNIYAKFTLNECHVTYVLSGCTIDGTESVNYGATILAAPTVKIGDKQIYPTWWTTPDFTAGSQFKFGEAGTGDPVKGDLILYGKYVPTAESFVNDPWDLFTSYIDGKTFKQISGENSPYHDEFISEEGKTKDTFVGLSRTLEFTNEKGEPIVCHALVVDENPNAGANDNKFTFMITDLGLATTFAEINNFYPDSYINSYLDILLWMFPTEVKQHMQTVQIDCYNPATGQTESLSTSLYIPSASQIFGVDASKYPTEGAKQFKYFETKDKSILNGAWLRTPDQETEGLSLYVNNAAISEDSITESHDLMPVFVIK